MFNVERIISVTSKWLHCKWWRKFSHVINLHQATFSCIRPVWPDWAQFRHIRSNFFFDYFKRYVTLNKNVKCVQLGLNIGFTHSIVSVFAKLILPHCIPSQKGLSWSEFHIFYLIYYERSSTTEPCVFCAILIFIYIEMNYLQTLCTYVPT
jgi:hypothetical protein